MCELLDWRRPSGRLKARECRALLEQMNARGLIDLPALRPGRPRGAGTAVLAREESPAPTIRVALAALQPVCLQLVQTPEQRHLWRALIERHHDQGHRVPFGAHLRYLIRGGTPEPVVLGCLQFSSPAWRLRTRDAWIGWDDATRARYLPRLINNSRFLILPEVRVKNLASHVLALALRTVTVDWETTYGLRPLLAETFVDPVRFTGHCYRAANWIEVGTTTGRGRQDRRHVRHGLNPKRVFLFPLVPDAREQLRHP